MPKLLILDFKKPNNLNMLRKILTVLMLPVLFNIGIYSQRIYFCSNYTASGEPISSGTVWNIKSDGGYVYILFQNSANSKMLKTVNFSINKLSGTEYVSFDVKAVTPESGKSFAVLDYKFLTAGNYQVVAKDEKLDELTKEYVTINIKETSTSSTSTSSTTSSSDLDYYMNSSIISGTAIDDYGTVNGTSEYYTIPTEGAYVIYKVDNSSNALSTTQLIVDVYKKSDEGNYVFFETKNYDIKSELDWIFFKYNFYSAGDFKLSVYSKEWKYINTAYTIIKSN